MLQADTDVPVPEVGEDQVLVRVIYAGVNPVETYIRYVEKWFLKTDSSSKGFYPQELTNQP